MKVLLIVDPQNDFISGSLAVLGAEMAILNLIHWYKQHKDELSETFVTMDTHPKSHCSFKEGGGEWSPHCVDNTKGWEIYESLGNVLENDSYYLKGTNPNEDEYSIFSVNNKEGENLMNYLNFLKDKNDSLTIYIAGIAGDYCVLNTMRDLVKAGFTENLNVLCKCVASIDEGTKLNEFINTRNLKYSF